MEDYRGGWSVKEEWEKEGIWNKLDALSIIFIRLEWVLLIVSIVVAFISGIILTFSANIL